MGLIGSPRQSHSLFDSLSLTHKLSAWWFSHFHALSLAIGSCVALARVHRRRVHSFHVQGEQVDYVISTQRLVA